MTAFSFDQLVLGPCIAAFGEAAQGYPVPTYTPSTGPSFTIDGIFDNGFREIDLLTGPPVASAQPTFGVRQSDLAAGVTPAPKDQVLIRSVTYVVREARPDGHGGIRLMLNTN